MDNLLISLNPEILYLCSLIAVSPDKRDKNLANNIFKSTVRISQNDKNLRYSVTDGHKIVADFVEQNIDFSVPYPMNIICSNIKIKKPFEQKERMNLEVPSVTFSNLKAFAENTIPDWFKPEDLKTTAVRIGEQKTDLVYMKKYASFDKFFALPELPKDDFDNWNWNLDGHQEWDGNKWIQSSAKYGSHMDTIAKLLRYYKHAEFDNSCKPDSLHKYNYTIYSDVYDIDEDRETSDRNGYFESAMALWQRIKNSSSYSFRIGAFSMPKEISNPYRGK